MTDVDVSKIKVGDVVGVVVERTTADGAYVIVTGLADGGGSYISQSCIVSHTPAPRPALKVGDRVLSPETGTQWRVVFIEDGTHGTRPHVHFGVWTGNCHFPHILSEVEQWERV